MATSEDGRRHCKDCRYWFERCCHALAKREQGDLNPLICHYFTAEIARLFTGLEQASC